MAPPGLTVLRCSKDEAAAALAPVCRAKRTDTTAGLTDIREHLANADCFKVVNEDGESVVHYALEVVHHTYGSEVVIVAALGRDADIDITKTMIPFIETQCQGANVLTVHTKRAGLVAKLGSMGFEDCGRILRKRLQ